MFKFLALVVILAVVVVHAYPATEEEIKQPQNPSPDTVAVKPNETDLEAGDEGSDLKPAETFGFGYYPSVRLGYGGYGGWGYSGYSRGYGHWNGYRRGWGYGGYPNGYYW